MRVTIAQTLQHYEKKNLPKDICAGIIIMAVSIPISMGYAQIAGLPAVYGLYGSVFPILLFALFSTSPQFIFGVDAAPAALIGGALIDLHIESGSEAALKVVPVLTLFVAVWLLAFYLMKAGKLVNYISAPVMGGFITGICTTIILMQVPKLFGGRNRRIPPWKITYPHYPHRNVDSFFVLCGFFVYIYPLLSVLNLYVLVDLSTLSTMLFTNQYPPDYQGFTGFLLLPFGKSLRRQPSFA